MQTKVDDVKNDRAKANFSLSSEASLQCNFIKALPTENETLKLKSLCTNHNCHRKLKVVYLLAKHLELCGFRYECDCHGYFLPSDER